MPFPSISFFHLPALAGELFESAWLSWGYQPLPTPFSWAPWSGGATLRVGGQVPSGDRASSEGRLGTSSRQYLGPSETAQSSCLAPGTPFPVLRAGGAGLAWRGCPLSQGGSGSCRQTARPFLSRPI